MRVVYVCSLCGVAFVALTALISLFLFDYCVFQDAMGERAKLGPAASAVTVSVAHRPDLPYPQQYFSGGQGAGYYGGQRIIVLVRDKEEFDRLRFRLYFLANGFNVAGVDLAEPEPAQPK